MHGEEGDFLWVDHLGSAADVLRAMPQVVVGHQVVIAAFDFGPLVASSEELSRGWRQIGDVVVSTAVRSRDEVPVSGEGDELWVFGIGDAVPLFAEWEQLGGYYCITLAEPDHSVCGVSEPSEDELWLREHRAKLKATVCAGLQKYRPLTFLRDDLIATRDPVVIHALRARFADAAICRCERRGDATWIQDSVDEFVAPYDLVERSRSVDSALYQCRTCRRHWVVAVGRERRLSIAVEVQSEDVWESIDIVGVQRALLTAAANEHRRCRWTVCDRPALQAMEICADHAYRLGVAPRETGT